MGIALHRLYLYPPIEPRDLALLVRVLRPSSPNAAQPAVDFAEDLADVKADALVRAWWSSVGAVSERLPTPIGTFTLPLHEDFSGDRELLAFHGRELDLWWTAEERRTSALAIGPGADEAAFWRWLDDSVSDRQLARLRRPAAPIRVRLLTEADVRFVDRPLLLIDDVDWLTSDEFDHLHRRGGLAALVADPLPSTPMVTEDEVRAVKLGLVERALADDLRRGDRRDAAFRMSNLAEYDPAAALAGIERLVGALTHDDDHEGIAWAFAYALHRLRGEPSAAGFVERWRTAGGPFRDRAIARYDELDGS